MICLSYIKKSLRKVPIPKLIRPGAVVSIFDKPHLIMDEQKGQTSDKPSTVNTGEEAEVPSTSQKEQKPLQKIRLAAVFDKPPAPVKTPTCQKKPPMKTAHDVINRVKWDESLSPDEFCVGYTDRFDGLVEKPFADFNWDIDIAGVGPDIFCIPQHRIQYFKRNDRVVWDKSKRLDNVFGSTKGCVKIHDLNGENHPDDLQAECIEKDESLQAKSEEYKGPSLNPGSSRPNCFIGFLVDDLEVRQSVHAYYRKVTEMANQGNVAQEVQSAFVPLKKLHVNFCVCTVNMEELQTVKEITQQVCEDATSIHVNFRGVGEFGQKVKYAVPDAPGLHALGTRLQEKLTEAGINMQGNFSPFQPHLTLINFRGSAPAPEISRILNNKMFTKWVFKHQVLNKVVTCEIGSTGADGFYNTFATYRLKDTQSQSASSSLHWDTPQDSSFEHFQPVRNKKQNPQSRNRKRYHNNLKRDVEIGKALGAVLRHNKFGFKVDSGGYVKIKDILAHQHFSKTLNVSRDDIYRVVRNNDKQRFVIVVDTLGVETIRATQGHTVAVDNLELEEITDPSQFPTVVHGTFWKFWIPISVQGLHRRNRIHIHMTTAEPTDGNGVISGMRKTCNLFIYIDIAAAMADGIRFFVSSNGVILSTGDDMGYLSPKYFIKVIGTSKKQRTTVFDRENVEAVTRYYEAMDETDKNEDVDTSEQPQPMSPEDSSTSTETE
uniref:2'-phosphotransferase n=1 Tax=Phallusia mammillata TaxID=59560 RepID=A0A6F9DFL6_9ASCI|nr:uncharacterized protein LOC100175594 [Phallusia mammillata]